MKSLKHYMAVVLLTVFAAPCAFAVHIPLFDPATQLTNDPDVAATGLFDLSGGGLSTSMTSITAFTLGGSTDITVGGTFSIAIADVMTPTVSAYSVELLDMDGMTIGTLMGSISGVFIGVPPGDTVPAVIQLLGDVSASSGLLDAFGSGPVAFNVIGLMPTAETDEFFGSIDITTLVPVPTPIALVLVLLAVAGVGSRRVLVRG